MDEPEAKGYADGCTVSVAEFINQRPAQRDSDPTPQRMMISSRASKSRLFCGMASVVIA
jgi:hypothetical protein